jgi:hypothetical protein
VYDIICSFHHDSHVASWENSMQKINLDALIPREDFEVQDERTPGNKKESISIEDLKPDSFFFTVIRKPDFQRETSEWEGDKVSDFITSFLDGDLIPAVILWGSPSGLLFVIDGSHRLSALAAWINNDYGDGTKSKQFYDGIIPDDQLRDAENTRQQINKTIGSYDDFKLALTNPEKVKPHVLQRAKKLGALSIKLQWVEGDAGKAEKSFLKINKAAAPINNTELALVQSRKKPNSIAARGIIRSGTGHRYWAHFQNDTQDRVQELSKQINAILFSPPLNTPVKTLDIPIAGTITSPTALPLILDFINIVNNVPFIKYEQKKKRADISGMEEPHPDDSTGEKTIEYLDKTKKVAQIINSIHPSSLGLHPVVYFYTQEGRHKPASFYATVALIMELEKNRGYPKFIKVRNKFEEFLLTYDNVIQQIVRKYRGALASHLHVKNYYIAVIDSLANGDRSEEAVSRLSQKEEFKYIRLDQNPNYPSGPDFTSEGKSAVFIKTALQSAPKCGICNGYIHKNSITIDHIKRKADGGVGTPDNGQVAHPYCNSTIKN